MRFDLLKSALLWTHVLAATAWIVAAGGLALAAAALESESEEARDFALRAVPRLNRLNLIAAAFVLLAGLGNIYAAASVRGFMLPTTFVAILAAKVMLYLVMAAMLGLSIRCERGLAAILAGKPETDAENTNHPLPRASKMQVSVKFLIGQIVFFAVLTVLCGAIALALGLWLAGT